MLSAAARGMMAGERQFREGSYWDAVAGRDGAMNGVFLYAVLTTGIYCRPGCPSRRPKRENVVYFRNRESAEQAGFRPCKRCRPDMAESPSGNWDVVERVCRYIDTHAGEPATLEVLSRALGISPFHLQRTFKTLTGIAPRAYADSRRLLALKVGLRQGHSVTRSMYDAGYGSSSRLYERAATQLGMTPARYRKQGAGVTIRYATGHTAIGRVLIAATERGVCSIQFGDADAALEHALRAEFPRAALNRADRELAGYIRIIRDQIRGRGSERLPLDMRATAFQRLVWEHLQAIPRGATKSYSEVARAIGHPRAARAVARACATNSLAVAIPCHRVVRENGEAGGYRWGVERKQKLLDLERREAEKQA